MRELLGVQGMSTCFGQQEAWPQMSGAPGASSPGHQGVTETRQEGAGRCVGEASVNHMNAR